MSEELCDRINDEHRWQPGRDDSNATKVEESIENDRLQRAGQRIRYLLNDGCVKFDRKGRELYEYTIIDGELWVASIVREKIKLPAGAKVLYADIVDEVENELYVKLG